MWLQSRVCKLLGPILVRNIHKINIILNRVSTGNTNMFRMSKKPTNHLPLHTLCNASTNIKTGF